MILVTGSNGQLANELKDFFSNEKILYLDKDNCDITDILKLENIFNKNKFKFVINTAAYTKVDLAEDNFYLANLINFEGVKNLTNICNKYDVSLIHISTDYVFDGSKNVPYNEDDIKNPLSIYGKTKSIGEDYIISNSNSYIIIRTSWLYSHKSNANFIGAIKRISANGVINIVFDQTGTPTNASDLSDIIYKILHNYNICKNNIYHFSNEGTTSWYDFAYQIIKKYKLNCIVNPIKSIEYKTKAQRPMYSVLDKSKIKNMLNIKIPNWLDRI
jgi:dTDP-4-dehydrorhamnose reductase